MSNNEKRWIVLLVAVLLIAVILIVVLAQGNKEEERVGEVGQSTETANEEKYITELNDGTKVNTSEEFNSTKMYGELEISNIQYTEQNGKTRKNKQRRKWYNANSISNNNSTKLLSQWSLSYKRDKFN